jgi:hypothetical protein
MRRYSLISQVFRRAEGFGHLSAWRQVELGVLKSLLNRRNARGVTRLALLDAVFGSDVLRLLPPSWNSGRDTASTWRPTPRNKLRPSTVQTRPPGKP